MNGINESTTAEGDCGGELDSDVGVGAHGIHALDDVLEDRFNLRIIGEVQHVIYNFMLHYIFKC